MRPCTTRIVRAVAAFAAISPATASRRRRRRRRGARARPRRSGSPAAATRCSAEGPRFRGTVDAELAGRPVASSPSTRRPRRGPSRRKTTVKPDGTFLARWSARRSASSASARARRRRGSRAPRRLARAPAHRLPPGARHLVRPRLLRQHDRLRHRADRARSSASPTARLPCGTASPSLRPTTSLAPVVDRGPFGGKAQLGPHRRRPRSCSASPTRTASARSASARRGSAGVQVADDPVRHGGQRRRRAAPSPAAARPAAAPSARRARRRPRRASAAADLRRAPHHARVERPDRLEEPLAVGHLGRPRLLPRRAGTRRSRARRPRPPTRCRARRRARAAPRRARRRRRRSAPKSANTTTASAVRAIAR